MEMHKAKRVEITIEAVMETRLTEALIKAGVTGFTILPVLAGSGRSGQWSREGQVSRAGGMINVVCIYSTRTSGPLLTAAFAVVSPHRVVSVRIVKCCAQSGSLK